VVEVIMRRAGLFVVVGLLLAVPQPGDAGDKDKPKKKGQAQSSSAPVTVTVGFNPDQRRAVEGYFVETYGRGSCPPGLAKKQNGCLPPGQAKKRYVVGQPLPKGVEPRPPAAEIRARLGAPPEGFVYMTVDGDLVQLAVGTMLVVDAIDGLVH
jgi:hypothetical protein